MTTPLLVRRLSEGDIGEAQLWRPREQVAHSTLRPDVLRLLAQLTVVGDVSPEAFQRRVRDLAAGPEHVYVVEGAPSSVPAALRPHS